ncbi:hypothetical protein RJT34_13619 [Clitoria ternatea]|uniref:Uncharacterized protein n=1 Tax=Clitoria ternatea TaxID=43366 RepID=A0AAN9JPA7_CLITE
MAEALICAQNWIKPSLNPLELNVSDELEMSRSIVTDAKASKTSIKRPRGESTMITTSNGAAVAASSPIV